MKRSAICIFLALLLAVSLLPMSALAEGNLDINTSFPDSSFSYYIAQHIDQNEDGVLSEEEIAAVTELNVSGDYGLWGCIASLSGIEYFTNLEILNCSWNQLTSLNVSGFTKLFSLGCIDNELTSLNASGCTNLKYLDCSNTYHNNFICNKLTSLNVNGCTNLEELNCYNSGLTSLDVSGLKKLRALYCDENNLTSLNVKGCTQLDMLICDYNELYSLDVSGCVALSYLGCTYNDMASLNASNCIALDILDCSKNSLTSLNVSNCKALSILNCYDNKLTSLNLDGCSSLSVLDCRGNPRLSLDISSNPKLVKIYLEGSNRVRDDYIEYRLNGCGSLIVDKDTQIVFSKPVIITQPADKSVKAGSKVTFKVEATGGALSYQWYCQKPGGSWAEVNVNGTAASYTLTAAEIYDGYKFRCKVTNEKESIYSTSATLSIITKPKITNQPKAASVKAGKKVTFKVKANGGDLTYQWYYQKPGTKKWVKMSGKTKATLSFTAKKNKNGYKYRCLVSNKAGKVYTKPVKLTVK